MAAVFCCLSCIETNYSVGADLMPANQIYSIHIATVPIEDISMAMADSLSGYSSSRITIGAIRDSEFGLGTRSCALTLVPMFQETLDLGKNPEIKSFHFAAAKDTVSVSRPDQERIFQTFKVYELAKPLDPEVNFDCNLDVEHLDRSIANSTVFYTGDDSLSFNFTPEFGQKYLDAIEEVGADVIDEINILQATYEAMREAIGKLNPQPTLLLNDAVTIPEVEIPQIPIIKGDAKSISIGAASIIAKVTRDRLMVEYDRLMPEYEFASNKGYGSAAHIQALKTYGPTPIHRRSFIGHFVGEPDGTEGAEESIFAGK